MTKEFVPHSLAVKLKILGFDWPCYAYIYTGDTGNNYDHYIEVKPSDAKDWNGKSDLCISRPLFQQAFRWFREKYGLCIVIKPIDDKKLELGYNLTKNGLIMSAHLTYEKAETACLEKLIEVIYQTK
jgi:hypothetical protein